MPEPSTEPPSATASGVPLEVAAEVEEPPSGHRPDASRARNRLTQRKKVRRLALVCNVRPPTGGDDGPDDEFEEFDSPATVEALVQLLSSEGYAVTIVEADRLLARRLGAGHFDLVFNMAEGRGGRCREALVPALCELLGIAYTGSDPLTLAATLDKEVAKRLVCAEVRTPKWRLVRAMTDLDGFDLRFPVFAKPNDEGSSKGIRDTSRCEHEAGLRALCAHLLDTYGRPVLVEEFVRGHEVTVGVIGNAQPEVIGLLHVLPTGTQPVEDFVYSLEVKRDFAQRVRYAIPPELPEAWCQRAAEAALKAFRLLDCRDVARIDFRITAEGEPYFIEANPLPGLSPTTGDLVLTARAMGWTWERLITRIVREAEFRQGVLRPQLVPTRPEPKRRPAANLRQLDLLAPPAAAVRAP
jgi:D-alanine-D-alanine ligase